MVQSKKYGKGIMEKILHISHRSDVDGLTPIILSQLTFPKVDMILLEPDEVDYKLEELIEANIFSNYDFVFMTDLCPSIDTANELLRKNIFNFFVIDHHIGSIEMNDYPFIAVIDIDDKGIKQSATSLYYQYLEKAYPNPILNKQSVKDFVELVRCVDTWDFNETNQQDAKGLANLLAIYGKDDYIENYRKRLSNEDKFQFTEQEKYLLMIEERRIQNYIQEKETLLLPVSIDEYQAGVVFAENYHSELGNALAFQYQDAYDFIVIINLSKGISYRSVNDIDVGKISRIYGGNGHYHASGSPLPKDLVKRIIKQCFPKQKENQKTIQSRKK